MTRGTPTFGVLTLQHGVAELPVQAEQLAVDRLLGAPAGSRDAEFEVLQQLAVTVGQRQFRLSHKDLRPGPAACWSAAAWSSTGHPHGTARAATTGSRTPLRRTHCSRRPRVGAAHTGHGGR